MSDLQVLYMDRREEGDSILRQTQLVQVHLLHVFDYICRKHGLRYVLDGGSCLGALRHQGVIPWDDDIDVGMPKSDYKKFIALAVNELPADVYLQTPKSSSIKLMPFCKLRDRYSDYMEEYGQNITGKMDGIFLDIFPYEEIRDFSRPVYDFYRKSISRSWRLVRIHKLRALNGFLSLIPNLSLSLVWWIVYLGLRGCWNIANICSKRSMMCVIPESGFRSYYKKSFVFPARLTRFEDGEFPVPKQAEEIMKVQFGNWQELPPADKRPLHASIVDPFHFVDKTRGMDYAKAKQIRMYED